MSVLVTGGTGFLGKRLQRVQPDWVYVSSKDYDLLDAEACRRMFKDEAPEAVVHLAARTGGIKESTRHEAEFYYANLLMGTNVIHQGFQAGVRRMLIALSTCAWPDVVERYPFVEADLHNGPPANTNVGYAHAKRALAVHANLYRQQYGLDYATFAPSNIYGPGDNFDPDSSHFVASLIRKVAASARGETLDFWGTGRPLRQELYVDDLARIIPLLLRSHHSDTPLLVAPDENLSIAQMCEILRSALGKDVSFAFNNKLDGQYRKDGSNAALLRTIGDFTFTPFREGVVKTYEWHLAGQRT